MKTLISAILLFAVTLSCQAGSGCEGCDTNAKKPVQKLSVKPGKKQVVRQSRTAAVSTGMGFCRDFYCKHAAGSPWWPGAPGD